MIAIEVRLNGKVLCVSGVGDRGVLTAIVTWAKRDPSKCPDDLSKEEWSAEDLDLNVSGSQGHKDHERLFLNWIKNHDLSVGDEIIIRILNESKCDPPAETRIDSSESDLERKRRYFEELKKEFGEEPARPHLSSATNPACSK